MSDDLYQRAADIANVYRSKPTLTAESIRKASMRGHDGDCINEPATCLRCWAKRYIEYAELGETAEWHREFYAGIKAEVDRQMETTA